MSVLPIIVRELRSQARQPLTHWLRMVGGVSVIGAIAAALWAIGTFQSQAPGARVLPNPVHTFGITLSGK